MSYILELENVVKTFGGRNVVEDVSFRLPAGHILCLLGPSGCGKTTTLRCIAGLERPTSGRILVDGKVAVGDGIFAPPEKRDLGMVFQSYAVWPHLTVFENVAFGLKVRKRPAAEIADKIEHILKIVGLNGFERRYPHQLSGGQQQRVALARSLAFDPRMLLFDEPLSNLDAKLREHMRHELREMLKTLGTSAVYVTHDQAEAMVVSDTIILMNDGRISQSGPGHELYEKPLNRFVADFTGAANFIEATVVGKGEGQCYRLEVEEDLHVQIRCETPLSTGDRVVMAVRPERIALSEQPTGGLNEWKGKVLRQVYLGREYEVVVQLGDNTLSAFVPAAVGETAFIRIDPANFICLRNDS